MATPVPGNMHVKFEVGSFNRCKLSDYNYNYNYNEGI